MARYGITVYHGNSDITVAYCMSITVVGNIAGMAVNPDTTVRKLVSIPRDLLREIEDFTFAVRAKTESEAIRMLLRAGLDALRAK